MYILLALVSAFFAGLTSVFAKIGMKEVNTNLGTALRGLVGVVLAITLFLVIGDKNSLKELSLNNHIFLILSGSATAVSSLAYFKALQLGDVNKVVPLDKSSVLFTIFLSFLLLGEAITLGVAIAIPFIMVGTFLQITRSDVEETKNTKKTWLIFAVIAAVTAGFVPVLGKIGMKNIDSTLAVAYRTLVLMIFTWVLVFVTKAQKGIKTIPKKQWVFLLLSSFAMGISWFCYYEAIDIGKVMVVSVLDKLSIVVTISISYVVFKEKVRFKSIFGLSLIVIGTLLMILI